MSPAPRLDPRIEEGLLRGLFEHSLDAVMLTTPDGAILRANPAACALFGRSEAELCRLGRQALIVDTPQLREMVAERSARGLTQGLVLVRRPDGSELPAEITSALIPVEGKPPHACVILRDVGARLAAAAREKAQAEEIARREQLLSDAIEATRDAYFERDLASGRVEQSARMAQVCGWPAGELPADLESWFERVHPEDHARLLRAHERRLDGQVDALDEEYRFRTKEGGWRWLRSRSRVAARDARGRALRITGMVSDIDLERRLRESEERWRTVVATMSEGVVVRQADGTVTAANAAAGRMLGLTQEQVLGAAPMPEGWHRVAEDGTPLPATALPGLEALRTGQPISGVVWGVDKADGSRTWVAASFAPLRRGPGEQPHAVVGAFVDITEQRRREEALREALQSVKTLTGLIPICMFCKKVRGDRGYWEQVEQFVTTRTQAVFSHGLCPDCAAAHYP